MENPFCWTLRYMLLDCHQPKQASRPMATNSEYYESILIISFEALAHWAPLAAWRASSQQFQWPHPKYPMVEQENPCKWGHVRLVTCLAARYELEHDIRDEPTAEPNVLTVSLADFSSHDFKDSYHIITCSLEGCCLVLFYRRMWDIQGTHIKKR